MNVTIHTLVEGAKSAKGIVVIIDVLRACTTVPILLQQGVTEIVPVKSPEDAHTYKERGYILIGEGEHGHVHDIFDYNNSPSEVLNKNFADKKVVLRSNNATQAILNAQEASDIVLASFLNVKAVAAYIKNHHVTDVTLVALGRLGEPSIEDDLCAEAIKNELEGKNTDYQGIREMVWNCPTALLVRETLHRPDDVELAVMFDTYPIVPRVYTENGVKIIRKV